MDSSRRTSSQRDITHHSSRDSLSRSRPLDLSRPSSTGYDRSYSTRDAAGLESASSSHPRAYNTIDATQNYSSDSPHPQLAGQPSTGYPEWQIHDAAGLGSASSSHPRAYNTIDATQRYSSNMPTFADFQPSSTRPEGSGQQRDSSTRSAFRRWSSFNPSTQLEEQSRSRDFESSPQLSDVHRRLD